MKFLFKIIISAISVVISTYILAGVHVKDLFTSLVVAIVLALLNGIVRPVLIILTIPATVVTLGLFLLVINALLIMLAGNIVPGFVVDGFWWALLFSVILSIVTSFLSIGLKDNKPEIK